MAAAGPLPTPVGLLGAGRALRGLGWEEVEDNFRVLRQCQDGVVGKKVACGGIRLPSLPWVRLHSRTHKGL